MAQVLEFPDQEALLSKLTGELTALLKAALLERRAATLVVSGGRTPEALFKRLSQVKLDWSRVTVTLADERWVPEEDGDSNAALVRRTLLQGPAAKAAFLPLYGGEETPEMGEEGCQRALKSLARPFDALLLGMGEDGHTASFFPGAKKLKQALNPKPGKLCQAIRAPGAAQPRMTLTLPALMEARRIFLLITGEKKRAVLDEALKRGPVSEMPVRAILHQRDVPLEVLWAP
jgi:6-phosphogluconolactonase